MDRASRPLWRCPACGHSFVTKNLWHSCGRYRLADHFDGKPAARLATFRQWVAVARRCGPVTVYAQKTRIVFQVRVRFAGAVVRRDFIYAHLWLRRRIEHPRLVHTESFGRLGFGHRFRLEQPRDIDEALVKLVQEAYVIGEQRDRPSPEKVVKTV